MMTQKHPTPHVPSSWGELIDKITILEIKVERLLSAEGRANAGKELLLLREIAGPVLMENPAIQMLATRLKGVNEALWEIEDHIRDKERAGAFDADFIALARSVYRRNDERGVIKREINLTLASELIEEKSYRPY
jgi:Family of unknown function (DUF6165)